MQVIGKLIVSAVLLHYPSVRATTTKWQEKKLQQEKSNFRKYNEIKTKCLLSLSNVKMFIKIANVRVWCWGEMLVKHSRLCF